MFFGIDIQRQECAFNPQPLNALLFSSWRNRWSANTEICHSLFPCLIPAGGERRRGRETFASLGYDGNKWIRGVRWQAWNGTSCRRAVRIVQEKVRFHRDYWATAAGVCCSPAGFQGRPTNPLLCSYHWQISDSLCVCVHVCLERERLCVRCVWSAFKAKGWAQHTLWPVNSSRAPRQQTTGEGGQMTGRTAEQGSVQTQRLTTAAPQLIIRLLWME